MFWYDNAVVHKVRSRVTWFAKSDVEELEWPAQSPDLNPGEHLWDEVECKVNAKDTDMMCPVHRLAKANTNKQWCVTYEQ